VVTITFSVDFAIIFVANEAFFVTDVSAAGVVGSLQITERGSHHLVATWTAPSEPNGIISSYTVICQYGKEYVHAEPYSKHCTLVDVVVKG